jgi:integrase
MIHDIDKSTILAHVRDGKGRKDHMVPMPEFTLLALSRYWKTHRHARFIFPAAHTNVVNMGGMII